MGARSPQRGGRAGALTRAVDLANLELGEIEVLFTERGWPAFHARQVYRWIWKRGITDFGQMTNLAKGLRDALEAEFVISTPELEKSELSSDGTRKFVMRLADGKRIEAVFIPDTPSQTFCISTQVGCAMGCAFCLTGKMGLVRHLTAGEIAGQVRVAAKAVGLLDQPFNIVLMGMGEPLHNYDATMIIPLNAAAGIPFDRPSDEAVDAFAKALADRYITVSVRKSRGRDIRAACGQLIVEGQQRSAGQRLAAAMQ
jgi:adenine C2-methylase RlmN of 23S rRNA A2503 and tRNA A37